MTLGCPASWYKPDRDGDRSKLCGDLGPTVAQCYSPAKGSDLELDLRIPESSLANESSVLRFHSATSMSLPQAQVGRPRSIHFWDVRAIHPQFGQRILSILVLCTFLLRGVNLA